MAEQTEAEKKKPKKVMVVIDESESSYNALVWVLDNLKETICFSSTETSLILFSSQPLVVPGFISSSPFGPARLYFHGPSAGPEIHNPAQELNRKVSLGLLKKAKEICACQGVNAETMTETGDPKATICSAVQKYKIDLLIIGCEDYGPLKRFLVGSMSDYCLKNANCSVLVVKKSK
ncbi:universal stress protein A-like protein isoform X2 [Punica granatum]|uniref:Universal stress protein A-like protein isoform X2 n=1 Tax=Punica granatum TaxID=22663 RepID=A0A218W537_PUNGR|nr:universal stress protein A-like protein isoform X2 [Punica granatum]OWM67994.1 hypothetical protein CDL15_Pgr017562 [Punica granatum]